MKKLIILTVFFTAFFFSNAFSKTWIVNVGQGGNFFAPNDIPNATLGDSVKFVWVSGDHTTTSTSVPAGALTWDAMITSSSQTYIYVIAVAGVYQYECTFHSPMMSGTFTAGLTGIEKTGENVNGYKLLQNYPNPFNPSTTINFSLPQNNFVSLKVYDMSGKEIKTLISSLLSTGEYKYTFEGSGLSSGMYIYKLSAGDFTETRRMTLIK